MKKLLSLLLMFSTMLFIASCGDDDDDDDNNDDDDGPVTEITVSENITADATWEAGNIYILDGRIYVDEGATLTIEPGTIIKGGTGQTVDSKALIVRRGGMINAVGTAAEPIIFTSVQDNIQPGEAFGTTTTPTTRGLWGGVILLGRAPISASNENDEDISEVQIEGIPTTEDALYGGDNAADNSGTMSYVSIRHSGTDIGAGNEIQGLTLGGVGSGTTLSNIEIVASNDDGIEFFGGNVNMTNVLIWNNEDDAMDTDQDWIGTVNGFIIVSPNGSCFELDGPEGSLNRGVHRFTNGTVYAGTAQDFLIDFDDNTNASLDNIYFYGIEADLPIETMGGDGNGVYSAWEHTLTGTATVDGTFVDVDAAILTAVDANANTVGPNSTGYEWTWAAQDGALASIGL